MIRFSLISFACLSLLMGCSATMGGTTADPEESAAAPEAFSVEDYRLGSGDRVRLIVFGETDLSGEFAVDGTGHVSLPLVGQIKVQDLTLTEFQSTVDEALRGDFLKDPRISAEIVAYRPFYILGEVKKPGPYAYQSGLTVLNAVATAEGFTYRANQRFVYIRRAGEDDETKYPLQSTTPVQPGDTIRIDERFF